MDPLNSKLNIIILNLDSSLEKALLIALTECSCIDSVKTLTTAEFFSSNIAQQTDVIILSPRSTAIDSYDFELIIETATTNNTSLFAILEKQTSLTPELIDNFDEYAFLPFNPTELDLRIAALQRKHNSKNLAGEKANLESLTTKNKYYQYALSNIHECVIRLDNNLCIAEINASGEKLFNTCHTDLINQDIYSLLPNLVQDHFDNSIQLTALFCIDSSLNQGIKTVAQLSECNEVPVEVFTHKFTENGNANYILVLRDITSDKLSEELLLRFANYDPLTGLPNRVLFHDRLQQAIKKSERSKRIGAVLFLDLDKFKQVNDSLGHSAGDELLREVANRAALVIRKSDTIARLGGDEFAVILEDLEDPRDCEVIAQSLINSISKVYTLNNRELYIGVSIGISIIDIESADANTLINNADIAMYRAKSQGRGNFKYYSKEMTKQLVKRASLENDLHKAVANNEFTLHYQPKIDLMSGRIYGCEALIRWNKPGFGLISPIDFIPILEESGFIKSVGEWVLLEACRQAKNWQTITKQDIRISVNISAKQFENTNLNEIVQNILEETQLEGHLLELEITETSIMENPDKARRILKEIGLLGVGISIDDFGTGYSSLSQIGSLPINWLKIDQSFIKNIEHDQTAKEIIKTIIALAQTLNMRTIAEGVEDKHSMSFLAEEQCDAMQGFYCAKPMPSNEFSDFLINNNFLFDQIVSHSLNSEAANIRH